jgi:transcription antitermination factor NusG
VKVIRGRRLDVVEPVFQGYVFAWLSRAWGLITDLAEDRRNGVAGIITMNGKPSPVPSMVIEGLRASERDGAIDLSPPANLNVKFEMGEPVLVKDGPLAGFKGVYDGVDSKGREWVIVDMFGRPCRTIITGDLAKVAVEAPRRKRRHYSRDPSKRCPVAAAAA